MMRSPRSTAFRIHASAFAGSFSSGLISDTLFKGKRAPVAALLYTLETISILVTAWLLGHTQLQTTARYAHLAAAPRL